MKITICDPCKTFDNATTETVRYMSVKRHPSLRLDICEKHGAEIKGMSIVAYARYAYQAHGVSSAKDMSDDEIKSMAQL